MSKVLKHENLIVCQVSGETRIYSHWAVFGEFQIYKLFCICKHFILNYFWKYWSNFRKRRHLKPNSKSFFPFWTFPKLLRYYSKSSPLFLFKVSARLSLPAQTQQVLQNFRKQKNLYFETLQLQLFVFISLSKIMLRTMT